MAELSDFWTSLLFSLAQQPNFAPWQLTCTIQAKLLPLSKQPTNKQTILNHYAAEANFASPTCRYLFIWCLTNVPATCKSISRTDLLRQFRMLQHCDRRYRSNFTISSSSIILTPGKPTLELTLSCKAPGWMVGRAPIFSQWYDSTTEG